VWEELAVFYLEVLTNTALANQARISVVWPVVHHHFQASRPGPLCLRLSPSLSRPLSLTPALPWCTTASRRVGRPR
jgi:hypothetical protein